MTWHDAVEQTSGVAGLEIHLGDAPRRVVWNLLCICSAGRIPQLLGLKSLHAWTRDWIGFAKRLYWYGVPVPLYHEQGRFLVSTIE